MQTPPPEGGQQRLDLSDLEGIARPRDAEHAPRVIARAIRFSGQESAADDAMPWPVGPPPVDTGLAAAQEDAARLVELASLQHQLLETQLERQRQQHAAAAAAAAAVAAQPATAGMPGAELRIYATYSTIPIVTVVASYAGVLFGGWSLRTAHVPSFLAVLVWPWLLELASLDALEAAVLANRVGGSILASVTYFTVLLVALALSFLAAISLSIPVSVRVPWTQFVLTVSSGSQASALEGVLSAISAAITAPFNMTSVAETVHSRSWLSLAACASFSMALLYVAHQVVEGAAKAYDKQKPKIDKLYNKATAPFAVIVSKLVQRKAAVAAGRGPVQAPVLAPAAVPAVPAPLPLTGEPSAAAPIAPADDLQLRDLEVPTVGPAPPGPASAEPRVSQSQSRSESVARGPSLPRDPAAAAEAYRNRLAAALQQSRPSVSPQRDASQSPRARRSVSKRHSASALRQVTTATVSPSPSPAVRRRPAEASPITPGLQRNLSGDEPQPVSPNNTAAAADGWGGEDSSLPSLAPHGINAGNTGMGSTQARLQGTLRRRSRSVVRFSPDVLRRAPSQLRSSSQAPAGRRTPAALRSLQLDLSDCLPLPALPPPSPSVLIQVKASIRAHNMTSVWTAEQGQRAASDAVARTPALSSAALLAVRQYEGDVATAVVREGRMIQDVVRTVNAEETAWHEELADLREWHETYKIDRARALEMERAEAARKQAMEAERQRREEFARQAAERATAERERQRQEREAAEAAAAAAQQAAAQAGAAALAGTALAVATNGTGAGAAADHIERRPINFYAADFVAEARSSVHYFEKTQKAVLTRLGLPDNASTFFIPAPGRGLISAEPAQATQPEAYRIRRAVRQIMVKLTATVEKAREVKRDLDQLLLNARTADARLPRIEGSLEGPHYLYACDLICAWLGSKSTDIPDFEFGANADDTASAEGTVFALARVTAGLMLAHPLFTRRFVSYVYQSVPYLVPTDRSLSWFATTPGAPPHSLDPERLRQLTSLLAAVHQTVLPDQAHPCGIDVAWASLARILNGPHPFPCAFQMLYPLLLYCAYEMNRAYGPQAIKLLRSIATQYLPEAYRRSAGALPARENVCYTRLIAMLRPAETGGNFDVRALLAEPPAGRDLIRAAET